MTSLLVKCIHCIHKADSYASSYMYLPLLQVVYCILCLDCYCLYMAKYGVGEARQRYANHLQEVTSVEGGETALVE